MAVVDELVAADHVNHTDNVRGPDEYKRFINMFRTAFPDLHMTIDFLNRWGNCRMAKQKRRKLRIALERLPRSIRSLPSLEADQDLDSEAERLVIKCYSVLRNVVGPTAVSKILHLTNPRFFVMWDEAIREDARLRAVNTADGYLEFLNKMRSVGKCVVEDFRVSYSDEKKGPAIFLSKKLGLHPPLSLAKFIDEYNWITVTRQAEVPPKWHP
jgi:hypothetical protein